MQQHTQWKRIPVSLAALTAAIGLGAAPARADATITAVVGGAASADQPLKQLGGVAEDSPVETAEDGNCAMLLEEDALIELCGDTALTLTRRTPGGPRVVDLRAGQIKLVAEPRLRDERIEIHTPVAIATILGTTVHIEVNEADGTTAVKLPPDLGESKVAVQLKGSSESVVLVGGQQIELVAGQPLGRASAMDQEVIRNLGGCLVDLHHAALEVDRQTQAAARAERAAEVDMAVVDLGDVAADGNLPVLPDLDLDPPEVECAPSDCGEVMPPVQMFPPDPCDGGGRFCF